MDQTIIDRYMLNGEREMSLQLSWVVERLTLGLTANVDVYTLPDYVIDIRRVTFKGKKVIPMTENFRKGYFQGIRQSSSDIIFYATDFIGNGKDIRVIPSPVANVASGTDPWHTDIPTKLIIEYYRSTDTSNTLPSYVRNEFLRHYIGMKWYNKEGHTQNMKASNYYAKTWSESKEKWGRIHREIIMKPRSYTMMGYQMRQGVPHLPVLPITQFGFESVDD